MRFSRHINHDDQNSSNVKSIENFSFSNCRNLNEITFCEDSELVSIDSNAFSSSQIQKFSIPSKVKDLREGWCNNLPFLSKISVSPKNNRFLCLGEKILLGKTDVNCEVYDILVFACRDLQQISIPSFVRIIGPYALNLCSCIEKVDFSEDSKLQSIEKNAFSYSSIKSICLPSTVESICDSSFCFCRNLSEVNFCDDSELRRIEKNSFFGSNLRRLHFPAKLETLSKSWCCSTPNLTSISISEFNKNFAFLDESNKIVYGRSEESKGKYDSIFLPVVMSKK